MGGATAVRFAAADSRLRRLVLGGIGGRTESWKTPAADPGRAKLANKMRIAVRASDPATIEDRMARRIRRLMDARNNDIAAMSAILHANRAMGDAFDPTTITVPTLVVCGDDDVSPEDLAAAIPQGEAAVLPGDHEGVVVTPEFRDTIVRFLD
jgi:pimeloyl-ACP methyl ester carboxylesterase